MNPEPDSRRLFVKVCGLRRPEDLDAAVAAGVDAIGIVRAPGTPRFVDDRLARDLLRRVPEHVLSVSVHVTALTNDCRSALELGFDRVQAFELEDATRSPIPQIAAVRDGPGAHLAARRGFLHVGERAPVILDGPRGGGRGIAPDLDRARRIARTLPMILAGGLNATNVASRVFEVDPFGVDASSGLELSPGVKDRLAIRSFVESARSARLPILGEADR